MVFLVITRGEKPHCFITTFVRVVGLASYVHQLSRDGVFGGSIEHCHNVPKRA